MAANGTDPMNQCRRRRQAINFTNKTDTPNIFIMAGPAKLILGITTERRASSVGSSNQSNKTVLVVEFDHFAPGAGLFLRDKKRQS